MMISIEVSVGTQCPYAEEAEALARAAAERIGPDITVERVTIDTKEKAESYKFSGSPSIRVNGRDVEGRTASHGFLGPRTYEDGRRLPPEWMVEAAVLRALKPKGLLFLCVANSARSQIAQGVTRLLAPPDVLVQSAGSRPTGVRPEAAAVLLEIGVDVSAHFSKHVSDIAPETVDTVITLCAEEECPLFLGNARRLHWGLPDPAAVKGDDETRLNAFRKTRDELKKRIGFIFE
jgi:arsenate reductase (thioredoxin)